MTLNESKEYIKSDLYRHSGDCSLRSFVKYYFCNRGFRFSVWLRLSNCRTFRIGRIARCFRHHLAFKYGIDIPFNTKIGYGLYLGHGLPLVISNTATVGNNCNFSHFVSIGSNDGPAAVIGDNVYIGPNACLVEDVSIGDNATVGAGAVVTRDVVENSTVVGVPAAAISSKNPGRYIHNKWPLVKSN